MVQERARRNLADDLVAGTENIEDFERLDRRRRLTLRRPESREVMPADEGLRGFVHGIGVEILHRPPNTVAVEDRGRPPSQDAILVIPLHGAEARVELGVDGRGLNDADGMRPQMEIHRVPHTARSPVLRQIEMRNLSQRMHARIGAAGAANADGLACEFADGVFEQPLN